VAELGLAGAALACLCWVIYRLTDMLDRDRRRDRER
jgi:hypothetical protein